MLPEVDLDSLSATILPHRQNRKVWTEGWPTFAKHHMAVLVRPPDKLAGSGASRPRMVFDGFRLVASSVRSPECATVRPRPAAGEGRKWSRHGSIVGSIMAAAMSARFDAEDLRSYARRDWGAPERLARVDRVNLPVEQKVRLAIDLYEAARNTNPGWPSEAVRRADLAAHRRTRALLDRAAHVGRR